MNSHAIILAAVLVVAVLAIYYYIRKRHATSAIVDLSKPPRGVFVENAGAIKVAPGQEWPDPASAGCAGSTSFALVTPLCPGNNPKIVNNGAVKCTDGGVRVATGCMQAKKTYSGFSA